MFFWISNLLTRWIQYDTEWINELPESPRGTLIDYVKQGILCRYHMTLNHPTIKFTNGILSKIVPTFILTKDPVLSEKIFNDLGTKKPPGSYEVFNRIHGDVGGKNFLSFRSHHNPKYMTTRTLAYKVLMREGKKHYHTKIYLLSRIR